MKKAEGGVTRAIPKSAKERPTFVAAKAWEDNPELIRRFISNRPAYEQLCSEVAYTLTKIVEKEGIPVAAVTSRAKELASFLEKVERKGFADPFAEMFDFAGARVVCYYRDDVPKIDRLIKKHFRVLDREDKSASAGVDRFGYGGIHFLVHLSDSIAGARYDDLKNLICEMQVRTVMQDAWAILSHHLLYKREEDTPESLRRSVNALAGALDTADVAFKAIREEREEYLLTVSTSIEEEGLGQIEVNVDSVREFLARRFPEREYRSESSSDWTTWIVNSLLSNGLTNLQAFDDLLQKTAKAREFMNERVGASPQAQYEAIRAIYAAFPAVRSQSFTAEQRLIYEEAEKLI